MHADSNEQRHALACTKVCGHMRSQFFSKSLFYLILSAFIRVHPRFHLFFSGSGRSPLAILASMTTNVV